MDEEIKRGCASEVLSVKEMTVAAQIPNIGPVTDFVNEILETAGCPMRSVIQLDVAIDELLSNIANYAYRGTDGGDATVRVALLKEPAGVSITFIDTGMQYDPLSKEDPDVTLSAQERGIGGLGVFMVKKTMDDMCYKYENGQNMLTITKLF